MLATNPSLNPTKDPKRIPTTYELFKMHIHCADIISIHFTRNYPDEKDLAGITWG